MVQKKQPAESGSHGLRVLFGRREALAMNQPPNTIMVVPSSDGWNDFGHHTLVDYRVRVRSATLAVDATGFIGFINSEADRNGKDLLQQLVSTQGESTVTATTEHRFFTMLPDMEAYRRLVQTFDRATAAAHCGGGRRKSAFAPIQLAHPSWSAAWRIACLPRVGSFGAGVS